MENPYYDGNIHFYSEKINFFQKLAQNCLIDEDICNRTSDKQSTGIGLF